MNAVREQLSRDLAQKAERHGVVIWDDPEGAYTDVVAEVAPPGATLRMFDGSWFSLRKTIESLLAGTKTPSLLVYIPVNAPDPDPLEELRAIGSRYRITLPTLLKGALAGQATEQRITQIGKQCTTLREAEAALEGQDDSIDARLISIIGDASTGVIAVRLLCGTHADELKERGLDDVVRQTMSESFGGDFGDLTGDELRTAAFRQVVLAVIGSATGGVAPALAASYQTPTAAQNKLCAATLEAMQRDKDLRPEYVVLAQLADKQLQLREHLEWNKGLMSVDITEAIEELAVREGLRLLGSGEFSEAYALAVERLLNSWWLRTDSPNGDIAGAQWRAISSLGTLGGCTSRPVPPLDSLSDVMDWYTTEGWMVDSFYRQSEYVRLTAGAALDEFDDLFHQARLSYETWLDSTLRNTDTALATLDVLEPDLQRSIHRRLVRNRTERTAYVLVDALRYELGRDLADRLTRVNADVTIGAAIGTPPTITPVGMAAVLPGADTAFEVDLAANNRLIVRVAGDDIKGVTDRVDRLKHHHGNVVDFELDKLAQLINKDLKQKISKADLVLVRSTEIDSDGESDQLAASWGSFDSTLSVLQTAVAKLLHAGIERVVITADHGFLAVRQLGEDRRIDKPSTGSGEQHRRAWIGRGGTASESTVKTPLAAFGIGGGLDIITPRGLGVFVSGGGLQFFHGGLSPQELIIPVITVVARDVTPEPKYQILLAVAGGRITTGVIAVTVEMSGDLFTRESSIRLRLVQDGQRVAVVVGGDGFDDATDTIDASVDTPRVITMQVSSSILSGSTAKLEVLDTATGVRLSTIDVEVAADITVEDDLD